MSNLKNSDHPDLDTIAAHSAGELEAKATAAIDDHLRACWRCRQEARRLAWFETIDSDEELADEANWDQAELVLHRAYRENVRPPAPRRRFQARWAWLAPVAAAAVLLLVMLPDRRADISDIPPVGDVIRGDEKSRLHPVAPLGEIPEPPTRFTWKADGDFDSYRLEIFLPTLEILFSGNDLTSPTFIVPDSLRAGFYPGQTYVWSVTGMVGLEPAAVTKSAWFTIADD